MRKILIQLTKDEMTQVKRGGHLDHFYDGLQVRVQGPKQEKRKYVRGTAKGTKGS
jgi:hypothetical protein